MTPVPVTVVIATRNRVTELCLTFGKLTALEEKPEVIVADNGSAHGSAAAVRRLHPEAEVIELRRNLGAVARNYVG